MIPARIPARSLISNSEALRQAAETYFNQTIPDGTSKKAPNNNHPTPEGLAIALGFPGYTPLRSILSDPAKVQDMPKDSLHVLLTSFSTLQDYYLKHSLSSRLSAQIVKFISNAYFNIRETSQSVQDTTSTENKTITIKVESSQPANPQEAQEIARLSQIVEEQSAIERVALGMEEVAPEQADQIPGFEDLI